MLVKESMCVNGYVIAFDGEVHGVLVMTLLGLL